MDKSRFQEALEYLSDQMDFDVRSYSGRGMYGKTCIAITGDDINFLMLGVALNEYFSNYHEDVPESVYRYRTDSLVLGIVIYWPNMEYVGSSDEED